MTARRCRNASPMSKQLHILQNDEITSCCDTFNTHTRKKKHKKMGNGKKRDTKKKQPQPREIIQEQEEKKGIRIAVRSKPRNMKYSELQNNS